jgi:hypothetical protein
MIGINPDAFDLAVWADLLATPPAITVPSVRDATPREAQP